MTSNGKMIKGKRGLAVNISNPLLTALPLYYPPPLLLPRYSRSYLVVYNQADRLYPVSIMQAWNNETLKFGLNTIRRTDFRHYQVDAMGVRDNHPGPAQLIERVIKLRRDSEAYYHEEVFKECFPQDMTWCGAMSSAKHHASRSRRHPEHDELLNDLINTGLWDWVIPEGKRPSEDQKEAMRLTAAIGEVIKPSWC